MHHSIQHHPHTVHLDRAILRPLLTLFMYVGVILFLYPYATSHLSRGAYFLICGATLTVICGALRCYLTDGDCDDSARQKARTLNPSLTCRAGQAKLT